GLKKFFKFLSFPILKKMKSTLSLTSRHYIFGGKLFHYSPSLSSLSLRRVFSTNETNKKEVEQTQVKVNYYYILKIPENATIDEIKTAYAKRVNRYEDMFKVLCDPKLRQGYDSEKDIRPERDFFLRGAAKTKVIRVLAFNYNDNTKKILIFSDMININFFKQKRIKSITIVRNPCECLVQKKIGICFYFFERMKSCLALATRCHVFSGKLFHSPSLSPRSDYYLILGIKKNATTDEIRQAHTRAVQFNECMYKTLSNPELRQRYDSALAVRRKRIKISFWLFGLLAAVFVPIITMPPMILEEIEKKAKKGISS
ncbi:hypothetical protein RFI_05332, partial [Reticulomyxa filosa]